MLDLLASNGINMRKLESRPCAVSAGNTFSLPTWKAILKIRSTPLCWKSCTKSAPVFAYLAATPQGRNWTVLTSIRKHRSSQPHEPEHHYQCIEAEKQATVSVTAPASKSVSHRYLIGASLAQGTSSRRHTLESRDLERTRAILCGAGARMETLPESTQASGAWRVEGMGGKGRAAGAKGAPVSCDVDESGTTCRLLTAVLAAGEGEFRYTARRGMHERPIVELTDALKKLGLSCHV